MYVDVPLDGGGVVMECDDAVVAAVGRRLLQRRLHHLEQRVRLREDREERGERGGKRGERKSMVEPT